MQLFISDLTRISAALRRYEGRAREKEENGDVYDAYITGAAGCRFAARVIDELVDRGVGQISVVDDTQPEAGGETFDTPKRAAK